MQIKHGDVAQFVYKGREFAIKGDGSADIELPGYAGDINPTGNGDADVKLMRKLGSVSGLPLLMDVSRGDLEFWRDAASSGEANPMSITLVNGTTYSGSMYVQGELKYASGDGTVTPELRGAKLEQI